jgi:hypothetical protein
MTVADLIAALCAFAPETPVVIAIDAEEHGEPVQYIRRAFTVVYDVAGERVMVEAAIPAPKAQEPTS